VGISGHLTVGEGTSLGPQAGVIGNIKPHSAVIGTPPIPARDFFKSMAVFKKLPEMQRDLEEIKKQYTWNDKKQ
jgi:UDP-3-O-[3-hydroxymyristoyl] glucosamine N-acyltransferase